MIKEWNSFNDIDMKTTNGIINNKVLYNLNGNKITIFPIRIEDDIIEKTNVYCSYVSAANGAFNMYFDLLGNSKFKTMRDIKKYFLDNIPHVTTVNFDNGGFTVQLTRVYGLDVLVINEY